MAAAEFPRLPVGLLCGKSVGSREPPCLYQYELPKHIRLTFSQPQSEHTCSHLEFSFPKLKDMCDHFNIIGFLAGLLHIQKSCTNEVFFSPAAEAQSYKLLSASCKALRDSSKHQEILVWGILLAFALPAFWRPSVLRRHP